MAVAGQEDSAGAGAGAVVHAMATLTTTLMATIITTGDMACMALKEVTSLDRRTIAIHLDQLHLVQTISGRRTGRTILGCLRTVPPLLPTVTGADLGHQYHTARQILLLELGQQSLTARALLQGKRRIAQVHLTWVGLADSQGHTPCGVLDPMAPIVAGPDRTRLGTALAGTGVGAAVENGMETFA
mmetsp:Transcript_7755/g.11706  ORF Transcript_7755/g.11706 Transcript_7755/m.11706 type:complete len:186 (+) Transcript_7755:886-1443(+)